VLNYQSDAQQDNDWSIAPQSLRATRLQAT
jgi:hypothetical protein